MHIENKKYFEKTLLNDYLILYPIITISIIGIILSVIYNSFFVNLGLFLLGLTLILVCSLIIYRVNDTMTWVKCKGNILESHIKKVVIKDRWIEIEKGYLIIKYQYYFDNKDYVSMKYSFFNDDFPIYEQNLSSKNDLIANKYLRNFQRKTNINIYVNPKKAYESLVIQGASKDYMAKYYFLLLIGLINIIVSLTF